MDRVPFIYDHPDVPELAPKAFMMLLAALLPIVFGLFSGLMFILYKGDYLPLVLLFIIPIIIMLFIARRKLDEMYYVARNRSLEEANQMFGKSMLAEIRYGETLAVILLFALNLLAIL